MLQPGEACTNMGETVLDVLLEKHPEDCSPSVINTENYSGRPTESPPSDLAEDTVMEVVRRISGGYGPGVIYPVSL